MEPGDTRHRQTSRFLWLYALATAGGAVAYVPFLTLLLPVRVGELEATDTIGALAYIAFAGAISASISNIAFGWLSDITRNRRGWILAGLALSSVLLVGVRRTDSAAELLGLIVVWQIGLNMMLAPLAAWAGDCVPDEQKGKLGGLLAFAPALGALSGALITIPGLAGADARLSLVAAIVALCVLPVLLFGKPVAMPHLTAAPAASVSDAAAARRQPRSTVARMWLARLLVQIAEAALFAYLLVWFATIDADFGDNRTATVFTLVLGLSIPLAMLAGRWSDRNDRPLLPLAIGSGVGAAGLIIMGLADTLASAIFGYVVFGLATSVFLALHSSQTLRFLPKPATRGRDLGIFNLTNTVPSLIMPWLTLALVPLFGFDALFLLLAGLAALATVLLLTAKR
ncbi:Major Facilitator Superfamily protein [Qipengyuania nanhaisediminis]|uniref:Major Facilitator Superfamily protein n=2 Tax=Qipengyuania nanhaisediminis TaxID=604088 RepID=A0A1I5NIT6_9SPHN|nr:MFS transporter [Qipengyuania nanhaisediminis]SFP21246.1 Major Facilitator Superfamily protein [Qipengyuania nanhaisediminis]